ncbi:MAG TPA: helix-turn-helix domain-containing protein [Firmicutes bacterium]|nr:helix-turn-helix domain-containing protein [Bacillota bacterium]
MNTFGLRLKELRKAKKLKQSDIANILGITTRNYQDYEYGKIDPPTSKMIILADYFNVSIDFLVGRSEKKGR